ncbi:MAG: hypothetical protein HBSAPP04_10560 [Ignavibacteriaceae bacterium]|nr:MAG: hypothetical protein EDM75_00670 [Chlorobiota bacterium]GJQ32217.1 MAG: hypothetical protein HBSAPP04_10560 [Ignavibacteriaceae bacterium]
MKTEEVVETQNEEITESQSYEVTESQSNEVTELQSNEVAEVTVTEAVDSEALFNRLKGELMEEIRKYFEPIVKEKGKVVPPPIPPAPAEKVEELPDEDDLIVKLLEETGWRNG